MLIADGIGVCSRCAVLLRRWNDGPLVLGVRELTLLQVLGGVRRVLRRLHQGDGFC